MVEILVVIVILGFLTTFLVAFNRGSRVQLKLFREQAKFVGNTLRAKSLAIQTFKAGEDVCGWGVHVEADKYVIFREFKDINGSCASNNNLYDEALGEGSETILLESGVSLSASSNFTDVFFIPPNPDIKLNPGDLINTVVTLTSEGSQVGITITNTGQVSPQ